MLWPGFREREREREKGIVAANPSQLHDKKIKKKRERKRKQSKERKLRRHWYKM